MLDSAETTRAVATLGCHGRSLSSLWCGTHCGVIPKPAFLPFPDDKVSFCTLTGAVQARQRSNAKECGASGFVQLICQSPKRRSEPRLLYINPPKNSYCSSRIPIAEHGRLLKTFCLANAKKKCKWKMLMRFIGTGCRMCKSLQVFLALLIQYLKI